MLLSLYRTESSANRRTVEWILSGRSLMYIRKRRGPSTVPCGTPDLTWVQGECSPLTTTLCSREEFRDPGVCFVVDAKSL